MTCGFMDAIYLWAMDVRMIFVLSWASGRCLLLRSADFVDVVLAVAGGTGTVGPGVYGARHGIWVAPCRGCAVG